MSGPEELARYIADYRSGSFAGTATVRVDRWLSQFPAADREPLASELAHTLSTTYISKARATESARHWLKQPSEISAGHLASWERATFVSCQRAGGSQSALLSLLEAESKALGITPPSQCSGTTMYVYVDDVSIHGMRLLNDLKPWITQHAPRDCDLLIVLQQRLAAQEHYLSNQLVGQAIACGKELRVHWWSDQTFSRVDCYFPASLPSDAPFAAYVANSGVQPTVRTHAATGPYFRSLEGRARLETALLLAGVAVLDANPNLSPRKYMRPLGNTIWPGLGLGVPFVTWRNCPNSAPLSLWADGPVPPLFPRQAN